MTEARHLHVIEEPSPEMRRETRFSTVSEVAEVLRVSHMSVYRLIHQGTLPAYRFGRIMRIPTIAVWDYIKGHRVNPTSLEKTQALR